MQECKVSGIVVGGEDYKEADRLVRILTPDLGVISAVLRGVKKEKARLKFAAMPFAFCEYNLLVRGGFYTVKTASPVESLLGVTATPDRYISASVMLEAAAVATGHTANAEIFVSLLTALKDLIYGDVPPETAAADFLSDLLVRGGYVRPKERDSTQSGNASAARLKRRVKLFENKFMCQIKSARLL